MKTKFVFYGNNIIWGVILLAVGGSMLIKVFFNIDIPIFRLLIGVFLTYVGLCILTGQLR